MDYRKIIVKPLFTEKSNFLRENGFYVLQVERQTNKIEIKQAFKQLFDVDIISCHIVNIKGKIKKTRNSISKTPSKKKAIIKLLKDQKIDLFE